MIEVLPGGVSRLHLLIQPKASKNEVIGPHNGSLKIRIQSPPVDGKANENLIEFLSKKLKIPKKNIHLIRGETSRLKSVEIEGLDLDTIKSLLEIP